MGNEICGRADERRVSMNGYYKSFLRPAAMNMVEEDGKVWMALLNRNGVCEVDVVSHKARLCKVFGEEFLAKEDLYSYVEKVKNYLVFSPGLAEKIAVYDLEGDVITYFPLKELGEHCRESQKGTKFWNILRYGFDVYLLGYSYPAIVKLNVESMNITYITGWLEEVKESIVSDDSCKYFTDGYVLKDDKALIPVGCMSAVLELDFSTDQTKLIELNVSMKGIGGIASEDGENIWIVGRGGRTNCIAHWNRHTKVIEELVIEDMEENVYDPFYAPICTESKVFLMPISASNIYEICLNTGKAKKSKVVNIPFTYSKNPLYSWGKTIAPKIWDSKLFFLSCADLKWYEYDIETEKLRNYYVYLDEDERTTEQYFGAVILEQKKGNMVLSEKKIPLEYFVNKGLEISSVDIKSGSENSLGRTIYRWICRI